MAANTFTLEKLRIKAELLYCRQGVWPFVALALVALAILCAVVLVPGQQALKEHTQSELTRLTREQQELSAKPAADRLTPAQNLARVLVAPQQSNAQIRQLLEIAAGSGVAVSQADYRRVSDGKQMYSQLQIALPVKADYPSLRRFVFTALADMPALSVDQMIIRRDQTGPGRVEAQLILSVWQKQSGSVQ